MPSRDALIDLVRHAAMAPSSHNTQPWVFVLGDDEVRIRADLTRRLPAVDPDDHALFISLGCALENLAVAAGNAGLCASVASFPADAQAAEIRVRLSPSGPVPGDDRSVPVSRLFAAIPERQTTRRTYDARPLPQAACDALQIAAVQPLVATRLITDRDATEAVIAHVEAACRAQFRDRAFVAELMRWIRFSRTEAEALGDGLAARTMGLPPVPRWLGQSLMRLGTGPEREARRTAKQVRSSSALMVFSVPEDTPEAWVQAGRSFERVALAATAEGIRHAHVNMPCEVPEVRERLRQSLALPGRPVLLIRLGYAETMPSSCRRPLEDVLRADGDSRMPDPAATPGAVTG